MYKIINFLILIYSINILNVYALEGSIIKVTDGDTIVFKDNNKVLKVRLTQIDAPESNQKFGLESKKSLKDLCLNQNSRLEISGIDKYERTLAIVYCNDINVNIHQLKNGLAWVYDDYVTEYTYYKYQNEAKKKNLGLWVDEYPLAPWDFRKNKKSYDYRIKELEKNLLELKLSTANQIEIYKEEINILSKRVFDLVNSLVTEKSSLNNKKQFDCLKKTCTQMLSCEEAYFKLEQCNMMALDRDKDGIPCESVCKQM
ncbi:thermonuclease family protein [Pelagibacteraceae bacterium]|nr:thermonuclease family protein [Pelagibacteraceae bacterium]